VCKRYGLEIGAYCSWLVRAIMVVTAPVSWPLGKALDALLGEESVLFRRQELNALISLHAEPQHDGSVGALTSDEATVIKGALDLASKTAEAVMTPLSKVFMLRSDAVIDAQLLSTVLSAGHSRVPVYEGDNKQVGRLCVCVGGGARLRVMGTAQPTPTSLSIHPASAPARLQPPPHLVPCSALAHAAACTPPGRLPPPAGHPGAGAGEGAAAGG
jgi:hypothetical protein